VQISDIFSSEIRIKKEFKVDVLKIKYSILNKGMEAFYNFISYFYPTQPASKIDSSGDEMNSRSSNKEAFRELISEIRNFNSSNLKKTIVEPPIKTYDTELKQILSNKFRNVDDYSE
jgi:hypothetical protein